MPYLCECRAKTCKRTFDLTHETYRWLRSMGAVLHPECCEREGRRNVLRYNGVVIAPSTGPRVQPPRSL